jgi:hypothetical protein
VPGGATARPALLYYTWVLYDLVWFARSLRSFFVTTDIKHHQQLQKKKKKSRRFAGGGGAVFVFCFYCFAPREASVSVACPRINQLRNSNKGKWPQNSRRVEGKQQQQQ